VTVAKKDQSSHKTTLQGMKESHDLEKVKNAILAFLEGKKGVSIHELLQGLVTEGYRESEVRRALWDLLSAHKVDVSKDYSLRRTAVCA